LQFRPQGSRGEIICIIYLVKWYKHDLIKNAEENGSDEKILRVLKKVPMKQYETIAAVSQTLSEIPLN
jgi:hypothetical protein